MNKPVFVSREWCEKVDAALGETPEQPPVNVAPSRFYDVRPVALQSDWTQNPAGVWSADAAFIVNDTVDTSFVFPVYAPLALGEEPEQMGAAFAVWRGRWELVAGFAETFNLVASQTFSFGSAVFSLGEPTVSDVVSDVPIQTSNEIVVKSVRVVDDNGDDVAKVSGGIPIVTQISADSDGYLTVTTSRLIINPVTVVGSVNAPITKVSAVTGFDNIVTGRVLTGVASTTRRIVYGPKQ